jgi:hypothetical protein
MATTAPATDLTPSQGIEQAKQFDRILEQSRDLICERLERAVAAMLDKAKDGLSALIDATRSLEERRLYEEARSVAVAQRKDIEKQFQASYIGEFRRRSDRARKTGLASGEHSAMLGQLELVGQDDFEETLRVNNMAAKLRAYCDEELVALDQRVGVLLGDADLQANDNPFSPQVICDAYKHACRQADAGMRVRRVLLKLFDDHVLDDIRSMYKAVNVLLVENSILPQIRYGVSRSPARKAPPPGVPARAEAPGEAPLADAPAGAAQDIFAILQNLIAANAVAMGGQGSGRGTRAEAPTVAPAAGAPMAPGGPGILPAGGGIPVAALQGAELMGSLTRIQLGDLSAVAGGNLTASASAPGTTNVLRELKATSVGAGMGAMDLMTLDIVAMLFDQVFDDPEVPNGVKGLIGRMQIPMLKVAVADKSFFSTKSHPARRLLDTLGEIGSRLPADFGPADPLFARLGSILQELVDGYQADLEIFVTVRERLEALLAEEVQRAEQEAREAARRMEEMERLALAKRVAEEEVKARIQVRELPAPILDFLVHQWLKLLLLVHVKEGKESSLWTRAVGAMDRLIWSIEPKNTLDERRKLVAVIPGLVRQLAVGLKAAGIQSEARAKFFAELIKYHKQAITPPGEARSDPASPEQAAPARSEGTAAAGQPAPAAGDTSGSGSASLDFSGPITVRNPFGEGEVDVNSLDLDFTALEPGSAPAAREAGEANPVASLVVGMWIEFQESGNRPARRPGRLIFVTPRKTRYLFAFDRAGKDIVPYTPGELGRRFRLGDVVIIDEPHDQSLFDRIMGGLLGKLRAPEARQASR